MKLPPSGTADKVFRGGDAKNIIASIGRGEPCGDTSIYGADGNFFQHYLLKKLMRADHRRRLFTIRTDKHASYPEAFTASVREKVLPFDCKLRRVKYLNNVIEQDHRFIKKRVRASQCFKTFHTAERTLEGIEAINMMGKGQVKRLAGSDVQGQAKFVGTLFGIAA